MGNGEIAHRSNFSVSHNGFQSRLQQSGQMSLLFGNQVNAAVLIHILSKRGSYISSSLRQLYCKGTCSILKMSSNGLLLDCGMS